MTTLAPAEPTVEDVLEKASSGERITDEDAVALLHSRDLVAVGRVANEIRNRRTTRPR
jgi:2-iminoacetate synthase ThiH